MKKGILTSLLLLVLFCVACVIIHEKTYTPKIAFFGDDITLGIDGADRENKKALVETPYPAAIEEVLRVKCENYGVGPIGWITSGSSNAYDYISTTGISRCNAIVVAFGTYDLKSTLGSSNSTDSATVMGQFNKAIRYLQERYPNAKIIVIAPWITQKNNYKTISLAMASACESLGVTFIDQSDGPVTPDNSDQTLGDGYHPTQETYRLIGEWLAGKLQPIVNARWRK